MYNTPIKIALVDDHKLVRESLAVFVNQYPDCEVILQADNGKRFAEFINKDNLPDILVLDINMPEMDGYATSEWVRDTYPAIRILVLTMYDSELAMIRLLQKGVRGFLKKDVDPEELYLAIHSTMHFGFYYGGHTTSRLLDLLKNGQSNSPQVNSLFLTEKELQFLKLAGTDMSYKEIAAKMKVPSRTAENYRDSLFLKFGVNNRTGLVLMAMRSGLIPPESPT